VLFFTILFHSFCLHVFFTNFDILAFGTSCDLSEEGDGPWHKHSFFHAIQIVSLEHYDSCILSCWLIQIELLSHNLNYFPLRAWSFFEGLCYCCTSCPFTIIHWLFLYLLVMSKRGFEVESCLSRELMMTLNSSLFSGFRVVELPFVLFLRGGLLYALNSLFWFFSIRHICSIDRCFHLVFPDREVVCLLSLHIVFYFFG